MSDVEEQPRVAGMMAYADVFRALSEPIRLQILAEIARAEEWPCTALDDALPVSKSTISHHVKILTRVGLIRVRKDGRQYYYRLQRGVLEEVAPSLLAALTGE